MFKSYQVAKKQGRTYLSILIPTLKSRRTFLSDLLFVLNEQIYKAGYLHEIEILTHDGEKPMKIGKKRNELLNNAKGEYVCFIDDDDMVSSDYIETIMQGILKGADCVSLRGVRKEDGKIDGVFEHSIKYNAYKTTKNAIKYERYPNHLNTIKASIAKQFKFQEINHGEDTDWATQIFQSGLIKTEYYTDKELYFYNYISKK